MNSTRVYPRLRACLSFSFTMGTILLMLVIVDIVRGRLSWDTVRMAVTVVCFTGSGLGLLLYGIGWVSATTISEEGLRGPTFWGFRTTVSWDDIASVERATIKGVPYLVVQSLSSQKELWFCILGFNESAVMKRLHAFVPKDGGTKAQNSGDFG